MRQLVATLGATCFVGGCSILYNPSNITGGIIDAPPDAAVDANASALTLMDLAPTQILEGQGDGNSRPAILVVHGTNIVSTATVKITATSAVKIDVDNTKVRVDGTSTYLAVPVTAHVDMNVKDGDVIPLTVEVDQMSPAGPVTQILSGMLSLRGLDELTAANLPKDAMTMLPAGSQLKPQYSQVSIPAATLAKTTWTGGTNQHVWIRAVSQIEMGDIVATGGDANGATAGGAGPGGCAGGPAGGDTSTCGGGGVRGTTSTLLSNGGAGGGAGFASMGGAGSGNSAGAGGPAVGDDLISHYGGTNPNIAGGGGGGGAGTLSSGGGGGGGGGTVELTAGGDVKVGSIDVTGGAGAASGAAGGGGAGGAIMLRAGHALTAGTLITKGGKGAGTTGGAGSDGRIRWDAPMGTAPTAVGNGTVTPVRGPSFTTPELVVTDKMLHLTGASGHTFNVYTIDGTGMMHVGEQGLALGPDVTIHPPLQRGFNHVCITLAMGQPMTAEADKCIDVAYLP